VTLGSLVLIGLGITAFFWIGTRRQLKRAQEANFAPHQFVEVPRIPGQVLPIISELEPPRGTRPSGKAATNATMIAAGASQAPTSASFPSQNATGPALSFPRSSTRALTNINTDSQSGTSRLAAFPFTPLSHIPKPAEAGYTGRSPESEYPATAMSPRVDEEGEIVIQHRDGGRIVRELPPPYADGVGPSRS
jgi:hypothetical protein